jgi:hypothetical protein
MAFDTFITYSSKDKSTADAACATLEAAGIRCWIAPRDIQPGGEYGEAIIDAIDHCRVMVLIFSSSANASRQIHREIERAVSKGVPIIPVRIEDIPPTKSMEYFLGAIHWLDALTPPLEKHLQHLVDTVKALLNVNAGEPAAGTVPHIYISYRRPSSVSAGRIYDRLSMELGGNVWMDIHSVPSGADFHEHNRNALKQSDIMVVVIGLGWLNRLNDDGDHVRMELESALQRGISIIPVLVDGASMPEPDELPKTIRDLAFRNAATITSGRDFDAGMERLTRSLAEIAYSSRSAPMASTAARPEKSASRSRSPAALSPQPPVQDTIEFGVSFSPGVGTASVFIVDAWIFRREDRANALDRAKQARSDANFRTGGAALISRGTLVTVRLKVPYCKVEPASQSIVWDGGITNVPFTVSAPEPLPSGNLIGTCSFFVGGLRIGYVAFEMAPTGGVALTTAIKSAFASYASTDRRRVLARVQGIEKLRVKVFMDVRDLRANDPYPSDLLKQIDSSDVLYLFWSRHASRSPWVEREWRYGMERKGAHFIDPVPLVDPRKVPPPKGLAEIKHFNDWTLAYLEYEKSLSGWDRLRAWLCGD